MLCQKNSFFSMICFMLSGVAVTLGMLFFFTKTKTGRRAVKRVRRVGRDMEDLLSL